MIQIGCGGYTARWIYRYYCFGLSITLSTIANQIELFFFQRKIISAKLISKRMFTK